MRKIDSKRGVFGVIKRELKRRAAVEPVTGHMKTDGHLGRCYLKRREGDAANLVLSASGTISVSCPLGSRFCRPRS